MVNRQLKLSIYRASETDDAIIADFGRRTFETAFGPGNDPEDMQDYLDASFSLTQIADELADPGTTFLLAYHHETLVGYAKLQEGALPECVIGRNPVQLERLYAAANYSNKGVGSQLINACLDEATQQGYDIVWLGVWKENFRAQRLYERLGFVRVGAKTFVLGTDVQQDAVYTRSLKKKHP